MSLAGGGTVGGHCPPPQGFKTNIKWKTISPNAVLKCMKLHSCLSGMFKILDILNSQRYDAQFTRIVWYCIREIHGQHNHIEKILLIVTVIT